MQRRRFLKAALAVMGGLLVPKAAVKAAVKPSEHKSLVEMARDIWRHPLPIPKSHLDAWNGMGDEECVKLWLFDMEYEDRS